MEELRQNYPEIKERLIRLEIMQQKDLDVADEWRGRFCAKMDKLTDMVFKLPCDVREGRWTSLTAQIKWVWIGVTFIIGLEGVFITALIYHIGK